MELAFNLLTEAFKAIMEALNLETGLRKEKREKIFSEFIKPSYEEMKIVYEDYKKSFDELLDNIDSKINPEETLELFKKRSVLVKETRLKLKDLSKQFTELAFKEYLGSKTLKSLAKYSQAMNDFFVATKSHQNLSYYSAFIQEFSNELEKGRNPFELDSYNSIAGGKDVLPVFKNLVFKARHQSLPQSWLQLERSYNEIKLRLI